MIDTVNLSYMVVVITTFLVSVYLGVWIFHKGPRERLNRIFALLAAAVALRAITDFGIRAASTSDVALVWARISGFGWIFIGAIFLHFVLVLTRREGGLDNKLRYLALYGPGIFFLGMLWLTGWVHPGMQQVSFGLVTIPGQGFVAAMLYVLVVSILGIYYCFNTYHKSAGLEKTQVGLIGASAIVPVVGGTISGIVIPLMGIVVYKLWIIFLLPAVILFAVAVARYKLFALPPLSRLFIPTPEAQRKTKLGSRLKPGRSYIVKPDCAPAIFKDLVTHDIYGLWITTSHPRKIRKKYGLAKTPILYLTSGRVSGEAVAPPNRLDKAIGVVSNYFFARPRRSFVFVDCFKELTMINGFEKALDFLKGLAELCSQNNSNLIVQMDPSEFTKEQLAAIKKVIASF